MDTQLFLLLFLLLPATSAVNKELMEKVKELEDDNEDVSDANTELNKMVDTLTADQEETLNLNGQLKEMVAKLKAEQEGASALYVQLKKLSHKLKVDHEETSAMKELLIKKVQKLEAGNKDLLAKNGHLTRKVDKLETDQQGLRKALKTLAGKIISKRCEAGQYYFRPQHHNDTSTLGHPADEKIKMRVYNTDVRFSRPFTEVPQLTLGITHLKTSNKWIIRVGTQAAHLTSSHFKLQVYEWSSTRNFAVRVNWMACAN